MLRALTALAIVACVTLLPTDLRAAPGDAVTPPSVTGITIDGVAGEDAWQRAARLPVPSVSVPVPTEPRQRLLTPEVRVARQAGHLVFAIRADEDPGASIGMHLMAAPAEAQSAAEAVSIDVRPREVRAPRYRVIGPRGVGRAHYRIRAAADTRQAGRWSLEASVPLRDLVGDRADATLRMAVVVYTRTQNVITTWPAGATWGGPDRWNEVTPPEGGWSLDASVDTKAIAAEDTADDRRQRAWLAYLQGASTPVMPMKPAETLRAEIAENLFAPLRDVVAHRPDLAVPVQCLLGDIHHRLGSPLAAEQYYADALATAPGWREAAYGLYVKVRGSWAAMGEPGAASDHAGLTARIDARFDPEEHPTAGPYVTDGRRLALALAAYKRGDHAAAVPELTALAARYPFNALIDAHRRMAIRLQRANGEEARMREADAKKKLPRATIETTAGTIELELFHDDARNTVFNFVWLAKHDFYNDCAIHRTVPFFLIQTGDPFTREKTSRPDLVGSGTPGYAIPTELGRRRALRGYVAMANGGANTDGSQFMIFTGTAVHLRGEVTVFARVVSGQDVVERLQAGAKAHRIRSVTVSGLDPERQYHPSTLSGNRAPAPKAPAVR